MNNEELTREDFEVLGLSIDEGLLNELKTYFRAAGESKEEFLKNLSISYQKNDNEFCDYLIKALTSRVFELERKIAVNDIRDKDTEDSLLDVMDKLNKIKKESVPHTVIYNADRCIQTLEDVLDGYDSKLNTIIKKAKKHVELTSADIDYLVEMRKHLKKD